MRVLLYSCTPKECCNILNGDQTVLLRKRAPKDFVGVIYFYCSRGDKNNRLEYVDNPDKSLPGKWVVTKGHGFGNGKVLGCAWCYKVNKIDTHSFTDIAMKTVHIDTTDGSATSSCMSYSEIREYFGDTKTGCAIHFSDLREFECPRVIWSFKKPFGSYDCCQDCGRCNMAWSRGLKDRWHFECEIEKIPYGFCYAEVNSEKEL